MRNLALVASPASSQVQKQSRTQPGTGTFRVHSTMRSNDQLFGGRAFAEQTNHWPTGPTPLEVHTETGARSMQQMW